MPDASDYDNWTKRLAMLAAEVELAHGDPTPGCNPSPLEMALNTALYVARTINKERS